MSKENSRVSGVLLHPTSLPGPYGVGDFGPEGYKFVDFLVEAGQGLWQVLPLGPTGYGDSPYACFSAFAGNTRLISPEQLVKEGLLDAAAAHENKDDLLRRAYDRYTKTTDTALRSAFETFAQEHSRWLDDYALFRAIKDAHGGIAWHEWEPALVRRTPAALERARDELREEIEAHMFYQFLFFRQWFALKSYAHKHGIRIVGDLPIFVAHDSADVWTNPEQFKLDKNGKPIVVAGVPPDYFSKTGQLWGNPLYNWERMQSDGFKWWIERVRATLTVVDIARVDHFRGFAACWEIPGGDQTAQRGQWVAAPGRELFTAIRKQLGELPLIAEDLGVITPDVVELREEFGFPGMRILQFGFGGDSKNIDLPHNYVPNVVAYTGTHDNDTTVGWFESVAGEGSTRNADQIERERKFCMDYLNTDGKEIHWDFIRTVLASVANTAIVPLQDLLGLGTEARMNLPNSTEGNWTWRYKSGALTNTISSRLKRLTELYGRILALIICVHLCSMIALAQAPEIYKVDPPSWWPLSQNNPVRLMIRGKNLQGARVELVGPGWGIGNYRINERGTYIFVDVGIHNDASPGKRALLITTPRGSARAEFEIIERMAQAGRFQGFSPDDVMYLIMLDRFADGDPSNNDPPQSRGLYDRKNKFYYHGGDIQGVINRLPYLKELGVTAIWLTPWYDNYDRLNQIELKEDKPSTGFHGYNPQDFYAVDEHFGTHEKVRELVDAAHESGMKIIQDQVMNHTGPYHPWVDDPPTPSWFNRTEKGHLKNSFQTWVLHDPRPVRRLKNETMQGWFLDFLPDLNQDDPEVARYLIQNTIWWIGTTGLDGIRMDTWQYVPNSFWRQWTNAVKREFPNFKVVGEVKDGDVVHASFFQGGVVRFDGVDSGLDSLLDFPLFYPIRHAFAEGKPLDAIPKTLAKDYLYTNSNILVTLLGGHDDGRFMSESGATIDGLKLANAFVLTTRGVPQLYYGDELAMEGKDEPTTRGDFPGGFPGDKRNAFTAAGRTKDEQEVFEYIRKLTTLRRQLGALRTGGFVNLHVSEQQYAYARIGSTEAVVIVINNAADDADVEFDLLPLRINDGSLMDRLGSAKATVRKGKLSVRLPKRSASIFVQD